METRTFIYDGWNQTAEVVVDAQSGTTNVTRYLWGPDVSAHRQRGGVGGLLAVIRSDGTFSPATMRTETLPLMLTFTATSAHYEYSPFGEIAAQSGDLADTFTHRFSTKPFDAETSLVMYQLPAIRPVSGDG